MRCTLCVRSILFLFLVFCVADVTRLSAQPPKGTILTVNDTGDSVDAVPGDGVCADAAGKCTLRAALAESNSLPGTDGIIFDVPVPAAIKLTLGQLDITTPVAILGRGARRLTIQRSDAAGTPAFRVFNITANIQMRDLTISGGSTTGFGGGIMTSVTMSLFDVAITGNSAASGGGIAATGIGGPMMERCLVSANTATGEGGGIYIAAGSSANLKGSTVTNNSSAVGGALANYGSTRLGNMTIARNAATQGSSSVLSAPGATTMVLNTIIGPDTGQSVNAMQGAFGSWSFNIVTNTTGSTGWNGDDLTSTNNSVDPKLGPLADNGGQTDSMALLAGSPAINQGDDCAYIGCPGYFDFQSFYDQRKFNRTGTTPGSVDIGAFESSSSANTNIQTSALFFGHSQRLAFSRVTVTNTETMERRSTFITLWDPHQMREGGTQPMTFEQNAVWVAEIHTKRGAVFSPLLCTLGGCSSL